MTELLVAGESAVAAGAGPGSSIIDWAQEYGLVLLKVVANEALIHDQPLLVRFVQVLHDMP